MKRSLSRHSDQPLRHGRDRQHSRELLQKEKTLLPIPRRGDIRTVVAYPNRYWIAMSNLGFQAVLRQFAEQDRFNVERAVLAEDETRTKTLETGQQLSSAELLAVSVSFETDYPYVLRLLGDAGVDLRSRREQPQMASAEPVSFGERVFRPFILGGGAALTLNPEPLANFFDAILIGESEGFVAEFAALFAQAKDENWEHETLLSAVSELEGVYVPSRYRPQYFIGSDGSVGGQTGVVSHPRSERPVRRYVKDLDGVRTHTVIQTPDTEFRAMFMTETGRGCEVGCKFCVAGYMYRPVRKRSTKAVHDTVQLGLQHSDSIGFVGAAVSSHPGIAALAHEVAAAGKRASLSSIMSQRVTPALASSLSESEYKTVALAPEAGSEALRFRVGKRVCDEQIEDAVRTLAEEGIRNFKLYFIVGLPSETMEDVEAIGLFVARLRAAALAAAATQERYTVAPRLVLSVNPFIPKAWTPFQRHQFLGLKEVKERLDTVRALVQRLSNVEMNAEAPRESFFQALLSRGDRRIGDLLLDLHERAQDWRWLTERSSAPLQPHVPPVDYYVLRAFEKEEFLPWEVVDLRIKRSLLDREYERTFTEPVAALRERARLEYLELQRERQGIRRSSAEQSTASICSMAGGQ